MLVKLDTYDSQWNFKTWVSTITRNTCIDWLRRRRRLSAYEPGPVRCSQPLPDEVLADTETKETVRAAWTPCRQCIERFSCSITTKT